MVASVLFTYPEVLKRGDGLGRVVGEEVVEEAEGAEGGVDLGEYLVLQPLDHVPLEVEGRESLHPGEVEGPDLLDVVLRQVEEG